MNPIELCLKHYQGQYTLKIAFFVNFLVLGSLCLGAAAITSPSVNDPTIIRALSTLVALLFFGLWILAAAGSIRAGARVYSTKTLRASYRFWGGATVLATGFIVLAMLIDLSRL